MYECVRLTNHFFRILLKAPDNKIKRIKIMLRGTRAGLKFRPQIEFVN